MICPRCSALIDGAARFCPYCGRELAGIPDADLRCDRCGRGFTITAVQAKTEDELSPNLT